jgi:hypothetical protein
MIAELTRLLNAQSAVERFSLSSSDRPLYFLTDFTLPHSAKLRSGFLHLKKMIVPKDTKQASVKPPSYHSGSGSFDNRDSKLKVPNVPEQRYRQSTSDSMLFLISRQPAASDKHRFEFSAVTLHTV